MLVTSVDPYLSVPTSFSNGSQFFHGHMAFSTNPNYHYTLSTTSGAVGVQNDLYTVTMHEIGHILGVASLIDTTGHSVFSPTASPANNFYSRYDTKLVDASGSHLLGSSSGTCTSNLQFAHSASVIAPNSTNCITDITTCSTTVSYSGGGIVLPVYTPNCFSFGSSLAHFEDMCCSSSYSGANTTTCTPGTGSNCEPYNNLYFLMSNDKFQNCNTKRHFQPQERLVLCDLGYSVDAWYSSVSGVHVSGTNTAYYYGVSTCSPSPIVGINDGLLNGVFIYTPSSTSLAIPTGSLLQNDLPSSGLTVSCVEAVYTNTFTQHSASLSAGGNSVVVNGTAGSGLAIVRYVPINSSGELGNVTYIFVYFVSGSCNPVWSCNYVQNGDFESSSGTSCGVLETFSSPAAKLSCWEEYPLGSKPFLLVRNCASGTVYNLGTNTIGSGTAVVNSFNGPPNNKIVALTYTNGTGAQALKNNLTQPLVPSQVYQVSFYAMNFPGTPSTANTNTNNNPIVITIAAHTVFPFSPPGVFPSGLAAIAEFTIPASAKWEYFSTTFTAHATANLSALIIGINDAKTKGAGTWSPGMTGFCYIDNLSLQAAPTIDFSTPTQTICGNYPIYNLDALLTGTALTAFSGTAVTFSNNQYAFNLNSTLQPGDYWITCTYTLNGCVGELYHQITISTNTTYPLLTPTVLCMNSPTVDLSTLLIAPPAVTGGTFYLNSAQVPTITAVPPGTVTVLGFAPSGTGLCSQFVPTVAITTYSLPETPTVGIGGWQFGWTSTTTCAWDGIPIVISAANSAWPYTHIWQPGSLSGTDHTVTPLVSTIYTVYAYDSHSVCPSTATLAATVLTNCCNSVVMNTLALTSVLVPTTISGPYLVATSFTVQPGVSLFMDGEFRFLPTTSITVADGADLLINDAHLLACGNSLWPGIVVQDGGQLNMNGPSDNLIEDAKIAIDASNQFTTMVGTVLDLSNTTFNRNYTSIRLTNYTGSSNGYASPIKVEKCVFTSRDIPFSASAWPQTGTVSAATNTSADLRYATGSTAGLSPPFLGQSTFSLSNLKGYNYPAQIAIDLQNVGSVGSGAYTGVIIGETSTGSFNVFDGHWSFIRSFNSNVELRNNVFQNTQRYLANGTYGGEAVWSYAWGVPNCALTMTASTAGTGNRFYDCHEGVRTHNIFKIDCQKNTFRSSQSPSSLASGTFIPHGHAAVVAPTNRFEYMIRYNEFTNINNCVSVPLAAGQYSTTSGVSHGLYASYIGVIQNTFSASTATNQFIGNAVHISCANNFTTPAITNTNVTPHASGIFVEQNDFNNVFRGVEINGNAALYTEVSQNNIYLKPDNVFNVAQHGVKITACLASNTGSNYTTVHENYAVGSGTATPNPQETLFFGSMNTGTNSPRYTCNEASEAYAGFSFESFNDETIWAGNVMQPMHRGLVLDNGGKIGEQGDNSTSSNNTWAGWNTAWTGSLYATYTGTNSFAQQSKIWCPNSLPANNDGLSSWSFLNWYDPFNPNTLQAANGGDYNCIGIPNNIVLPVPDVEMYETDALYSTAENLVYRMIHLDPGVTASGEDLHEFYLSLASSKAADFMAVETELFSGDYSAARTINEGIDAEDQNECEVSYKQFYSLYANYLETVEDEIPFPQDYSDTLFDLASLCPALHGPAVYQARALYQYIYPSSQQFGNCEGGSGDRRAIKEKPAGKDPRWNVKLIPNPFQNEFTVLATGRIETATVLIADITGRKILETNIDLRSGSQPFLLSVAPGVYFVTVSDADGKSVTQKLISTR